MKYVHLFVITVLLIAKTTHAQTVHQTAFINPAHVNMGGDIAWSGADRTYVTAWIENDTLYNESLRVMKIDSTGVPVWTQSLTINSPDTFLGFPKVCVGDNGMIYCASYYIDGFSNDIAYYVLAVHEWGALNWSGVYKTSATVVGLHPELSILPDGNLLLFEAVDYMGMVKLDPQGNLVHTRRISESATGNGIIRGRCSAVAPDGSIFMAGEWGSDISLVKLDSNGFISWSRLWQWNNNWHRVRGLLALPDGSCIVSGYCDSGAFLMCIDPNASISWYKVFDTWLAFSQMELLNDSVFVAEGNDIHTYVALTTFDVNGNLLEQIRTPLAPENEYFGSCRIAVNPQGRIAWLYEFDNHNTTLASAVVIMDQLATSGCNLQTGTLTEISAPLPSVASPAMHRVSQAVSRSPFAVAELSIPQQYVDLCYAVNVPEPVSAPGSALHLLNSGAAGGQPLLFTLDNYVGAYSYSVLDLSGKVVVSGNGLYTTNMQVSVDAAGAANGLYVLQVVTENGVLAERFITPAQ